MGTRCYSNIVTPCNAIYIRFIFDFIRSLRNDAIQLHSTVYRSPSISESIFFFLPANICLQIRISICSGEGGYNLLTASTERTRNDIDKVEESVKISRCSLRVFQPGNISRPVYVHVGHRRGNIIIYEAGIIVDKIQGAPCNYLRNFAIRSVEVASREINCRA